MSCKDKATVQTKRSKGAVGALSGEENDGFLI